MKTFRTLLLAGILLMAVCCKAQPQPADFSVAEVTRIESVLASNEMRGRRTGSVEIDKAADFIAAEFKKAGLQPLQGASFLQPFTLLRPRLKSLSYTINNTAADTKNIVVVTSTPELSVTAASGYEVVRISKGDNLPRTASGFAKQKKNLVVSVDTAFAKDFGLLTRLKRQIFASAYSTIFILGDVPAAYTIGASHSFEETRLTNVVGVLPGRSKATEQVVFSAHYDHLGIGKPQAGDSIYNGANDDAAGTTAVIMLADYFRKLGNNERTLVFAAFTAEEIGGYGSQYFSQGLDADKVAAMFNIEMIGTESKWGRNSAYITGYDKTNMGEILQDNLKGTGFTFHPDPYTEQNLFYRSDNATLARLGVPAHTISTSKMDNEPNYHQASDEVSTLDMENMAQIIKAIAQSSKTIISGKDTPGRVKVEGLR